MSFKDVWYSLIFLVLFILFCCAGQVLAAPRSSPSPSISTTTTTPPPAKCCFCVTPNPGEDDFQRNTKRCSVCFANNEKLKQSSGCASIEVISRADFKKRSQGQKGQCNDLQVWHVDHGPDQEKTETVFEVCKSLSCNRDGSINIRDLSCRTGSSEKLPSMLAELQRAAGPDATVTYLGNVTTNVSDDICNNEAIKQRYVVSSCGVDRGFPSCEQAGYKCAEPGKIFKCTVGDTNILKEQTCCAYDSPEIQGNECDNPMLGIWTEPGQSCSSAHECPALCNPNRFECVGNMAFHSNCRTLCSGAKMCLSLEMDCEIFGRECRVTDRGTRCVLPPASSTPTPTTSPTPAKTIREAQQQGAPGNGRSGTMAKSIDGSFLEVDRQEMAFSVSRPLFQRLVANPLRLFGESEFDVISFKLRFKGLSFSKIDPQSSLGVFLFRQGDLIVRVNGIKTPNAKDLIQALKTTSDKKTTKVVKITFVRKHIFHEAVVTLTDEPTENGK